MTQDPNTTPEPGPAPAGQQAAKGFFGKLFDFSFQEFITLQLIKVIFIILVAFAALGALGIFISFATQGAAALILGLIVAPIVFLVYVILIRVWLEVLIVVFRIADNTGELVRQGRGQR